MFRGSRFRTGLFVAGVALLLGSGAQAVTMDWVTVGGAGNACDTQSQGCFGAVDYTYQVGKYEVTNAQYAELLNAVAAIDDSNALYSTSMASGYGGITRSGSSGSYTYSTIAGRANMPVNYVSYYDSLRFANWLQNGQLTGAQDSSTTEDGAYTFSGASSVSERNGGATIFLSSEDEWYKAAYFNASTSAFYDYTAGTDTQTSCATPGATANTANCWPAVQNVTDVGSYTGSASPNSTFDQGGNVWEWNEALISSNRGLRGGAFDIFPSSLAASTRYFNDPTLGINIVGFRVASIPEPGTGLLLMTGLLGLAWGQRARA